MQLLRVTPERIRLGSETVLTVTGKNIRAPVRIDLDSTKPPELGRFVAWVGDLGPLTGVVVVDAEELQIVVPEGLGLGTHALVVGETLSGGTARIPNAVEVFDDGGEVEDGGVDALPVAVFDAATAWDAAIADARDAGIDARTPSASGSSGPDADAQGGAAPGSCAGVAHGGLCWYIGEGGASCEQTCAPHGGFVPEAAAFVGTAGQGGSLAQCTEILGLLGRGQPVIQASRADVGVGCHLWGVEEQSFWLTAPDFSPTAGLSSARIVCGCSA